MKRKKKRKRKEKETRNASEIKSTSMPWKALLQGRMACPLRLREPLDRFGRRNFAQWAIWIIPGIFVTRLQGRMARQIRFWQSLNRRGGCYLGEGPVKVAVEIFMFVGYLWFLCTRRARFAVAIICVLWFLCCGLGIGLSVGKGSENLSNFLKAKHYRFSRMRS